MKNLNKKSFGYVYSIIDPIINEIIYIGQTTDIKQRFRSYFIRHHNINVHLRINKIIENGSFPIFKVEWSGDFKQALIKEHEYIIMHAKTILNSKISNCHKTVTF